MENSRVRSSVGNKDNGNLPMSAGLLGMSSVMRRGIGFSVCGTYSRRNWRLRRVTLPDPCTSNGVLVVLPDLDDLFRLVPGSWRIPRLILDTDAVFHLQWRHFPCNAIEGLPLLAWRSTSDSVACLTVVAQLLDLDRDSWPEDRCFPPCVHGHYTLNWRAVCSVSRTWSRSDGEITIPSL